MVRIKNLFKKMKKENPSVAPFAARLELNSSSRLKFWHPSISATGIHGVTQWLMESKARWSREARAELAGQSFQALSVAASLSRGDGALRWQVTTWQVVCVHASAPNPPHSFSGRSKAQAGSQPISSISVARKVPRQPGSPGTGQQ